ncbi:MAG: hypothetical protein AseanaTS_04590 [Candidatus Pelagadaptatus aseana]|uniref:hypothetical protein n=1 Tax=Candidatus Pelagadaptatus aseana TaxID=3120508 RepID=UPI0039B1DC3C
MKSSYWISTSAKYLVKVAICFTFVTSCWGMDTIQLNSTSSKGYYLIKVDAETIDSATLKLIDNLKTTGLIYVEQSNDAKAIKTHLPLASSDHQPATANQQQIQTLSF